MEDSSCVVPNKAVGWIEWARPYDASSELLDNA
jgi:hypothetical protein